MYVKRFLNAAKVRELLADGVSVKVVELVIQGNITVEEISVVNLDSISEFKLNEVLEKGCIHYEIKVKGSDKVIFPKVYDKTTANKILWALK